MTDTICETVGVVLAGGLARRMGGGDKPLRTIGGRTILDHVLARLAPQCDTLVVNANGDPARFAHYGLPVVPDTVAGHPGPLAGVLAALDWAAEHRPEAEFVVTAPGDCPFLPRDLVARLQAARIDGDADLSVAQSGGQTHPVIGLWRVALRADLRKALVEEDIRKISRWQERHACVLVDWPTEPVDPFFNANTPEDLGAAERLAMLLPD
ncbi:molybdenum cofactor guanylyltransferase [Aureimonas sp. SA4125]|uniref:molybdenum cofactor guanylyltransferase MobA n=1 Tax=Aureimonas sp. SA4125 TaxID=2826993 RepID=UPI001CC7C430|nr:molybdenum cofactor guanylyltransferase MobA [Aureimonas sp. SA4125]BDA84149.1 molybdenum cofactor guanylyltransferase [Aureimonas sp. SA4125]